MTRLIILGCLRYRPMHPYEVQQLVQQSEMERWSEVLSGSIYFAFRQMQKEGLVEPLRQERQGARSRTIYQMTPAGEAEFLRLLREAWGSPLPRLSSPLFLALGFLDALPRAEVLAAIDRQMERVQQEMAAFAAGEAHKTAHGPPWALLVFDYSRRRMELDLAFLRQLRATLPDAAPPPPPPMPTELL